MQQEQHAKSGDDYNHHEQPGEEIPSIQRRTVAAICVWFFVFFSVIFWVFLRKQIPVQSEYIKVSIESMFSIALVIVVVVQTYINFRQARALDIQEHIFRDQAKIMENTLIVSNRASVAVHSIEMNKAQKTVLVRIENTGNRPAEHIKLFLQLVSYMPPEIGEKDEPITQEIKRSFSSPSRM